ARVWPWAWGSGCWRPTPATTRSWRLVRFCSATRPRWAAPHESRSSPMAELTTRERLQPSLLDRLTDRNPGSSQEGRDDRVLSVSQIKAAVLRDLGWLLNTACHSASASLDEFPEVEKSVFNFGMPSLSGLT